jgi:hypothetical protein
MGLESLGERRHNPVDLLEADPLDTRVDRR